MNRTKVVLLKTGYSLEPKKPVTELGQLVIDGIIGESPLRHPV